MDSLKKSVKLENKAAIEVRILKYYLGSLSVEEKNSVNNILQTNQFESEKALYIKEGLSFAKPLKKIIQNDNLFLENLKKLRGVRENQTKENYKFLQSSLLFFLVIFASGLGYWGFTLKSDQSDSSLVAVESRRKFYFSDEQELQNLVLGINPETLNRDTPLGGLSLESEGRSLASAQVQDEKSNTQVSETKKLIEPNQTENSDTLTNSLGSAGYVLRGTLFVTDLELANQEILKNLKELSAEKAGQVELGWEKSPTIRYFHFTTARSFEEKIPEILRNQGQLTWSKEAHPRAMPENVSRYVLEVKLKR